LKTSPFATERSLQGVGGGANLSAALGGLDILVNNAGRQQSRESILDV
jgi:NAD(P)-dependent dehydrogenase (short-subunit alcohol dehydrogenase family)